jgi:ferredoxin-NADP reductase
VVAQFTLTLAARTALAPAVDLLEFSRGDGEALDYLPGQFIQVHFPLADGSMARRSYSLSSPHRGPRQPGDPVELAVSLVEGGAASALFRGMTVGDTVRASGPFGRFCLMPGDDNRRYLLLGTGTGVSPYRAMLPALEAAMATRGVEVVLVQGARQPADMLFSADFRALAAREPRFTYLACHSRTLPASGEPAAAHARAGYVQEALDGLAPDPATDIAYLCGNPGMVDAGFEVLKARGFGMARIRREKYISNR